MRWLCWKGVSLVCVLLLNGVFSFGQARIGINGAVEWDRMEINAVISLDLASAGIRLPAGRMQGEAILASEYLRLIRPEILNIQVDSSSVIADLIGRGEWSLFEIENLALQARAVPPALSPRFDRLSASYTIGIEGISEAFIRHRQPIDVPRTLTPVPAPAFTGIIIIASDMQSVHGREGSALVRPALFPKIWDSQMNLIFERNMLDPNTGAMVRYFCRQGIFAGGPTGLSPELTSVVGDRPLRVFARGVFGASPTDPIISREDALQIISTPENRNLLREGRVAIILDDSVLRNNFTGW
ncbi:MAG: polymerase [Treponema sp.]|nr:polymerase [Treponema sp.]